MNSRAAKNLANNLVSGAGKVVKKIVKAPMKYVDSYIEKSKKMDEWREHRNTKMIEDNWGSVENYRKINK